MNERARYTGEERLHRLSAVIIAIAGCTPGPPPGNEPAPDAPANAEATSPTAPSTPTGSPSEPERAATPPAVMTSAPPPSAAPPPDAVSPAPRAVVFFRSAGEKRGVARGRAWKLGSDTEPSKQLPWTADVSGSGTMGIGNDMPKLSADGRWLAFEDLGRLSVADLDGTAKARLITTSRDLSLLIPGFSPDSKALIFHIEEIMGEEDTPPLPPGVVAGFHRLVLPDFASEHLPKLRGFESWSADSVHVVHVLEGEGNTRLIESDLAGGERELQSSSLVYAFSQMAVQGQRMYWSRHADADSVQIASARLDGSDLVELTEPGRWATQQFPRPAPDEKHVAYVDSIHVPASVPRQSIGLLRVSDRAVTEVLSCKDACRHAWESPTRLLVLDGTDLIRVSVDGSAETLESSVAAFAVAGDNE